MATRTHVVLPDDLLAELDELVGPRRRSEFITEAIRDKLINERQRRAMKESFGILRDSDTPGWDTPENISAWVRESREQDNDRLEQILAYWSKDA